MRTFDLRPSVIAAALILAPAAASADCSAEIRQAALGTGQSRETVPLRSFVCRAGINPSSPQVRVEFHRLSDGAASTLVQKRSARALTQLLGSPRIVENDVFKTYADLLGRFGATSTTGDFGPRLEVAAPQSGSATVEDSSVTKATRTLNTIARSDGAYHLFFPAASEIEALIGGSLPAPLKFYYRQTGEPNSPPYTEMLFWRSLGPDDVKNYAENAQAFNRLLQRLRSQKRTTGDTRPTAVPVMLKLLQYMAGDRWPSDFVIMFASVDADQIIRRSKGEDQQGCGDEAIANLTFEIPYPTIIVDSVLIENISNTSIRIDSLYGSQSSVSTLRALGSDSAKLTSASFDMSRTLAPGERLLILTRISFVPQVWGDTGAVTDNVADWSKRLRASTQVQKKFGTSGLRGSPANHAVPILKTYVFGPELSVAGLTVNGARIDLEQRSANFADLVMSMEGLSCPYLSSWDEASKAWVEHGKVLDQAPHESREYSELKSFPGFRSRFRIEEREPEIAFVKDVELVATLNDGTAITLKPNKVVTAAEREGDYLSLYWGEAAEFEFELPRDIAEDQVVTSRFAVTGYYRRYSALLSQAIGAGTRALSPHPLAASNR